MKKLVLILLLVLLGQVIYAQFGFLPKNPNRTKEELIKAMSGSDVRTTAMINAYLKAVNEGMRAKGINKIIPNTHFNFLVENTTIVKGDYLISIGVTTFVNHAISMDGNVVSMVNDINPKDLYGLFSYSEWGVKDVLWIKWHCANAAEQIFTQTAPPSTSQSAPPQQEGQWGEKKEGWSYNQTQQSQQNCQHHCCCCCNNNNNFQYAQPPTNYYQSQQAQTQYKVLVFYQNRWTWRPESQCQGMQYRDRRPIVVENNNYNNYYADNNYQQKNRNNNYKPPQPDNGSPAYVPPNNNNGPAYVPPNGNVNGGSTYVPPNNSGNNNRGPAGVQPNGHRNR